MIDHWVARSSAGLRKRHRSAKVNSLRTVLCYGDSNAYGAAVVDRMNGRYLPDERWTGVLAARLGPQWRVIEEVWAAGLPCVTTRSKANSAMASATCCPVY